MSQKNPNSAAACPLGDNDCPIYDEISSLRDEVKSLGELIRTDHLTGLFNRRHFHYSLEQELERTRRSRQPTTLVLLDVDHFKRINDTHGHIIGDKILVHIAQVVQHTVRRLDIACRYGGEEFAIILPATHTLTGIQVAERIRKKIQEDTVRIDKNTVETTVSLGVASYSQADSESIEAFVARADAQLYLAKENGRNQVRADKDATASSGRAQVTEDEKAALFGGNSDTDS